MFDLKRHLSVLFCGFLTLFLAACDQTFVLTTDLPDSHASAGFWQGTSSAAPSAPPKEPPERWYITNTGKHMDMAWGAIGKNLQDVSFWDDAIGVAVGDLGVFKTLDGGFTWTKLKVDPEKNWRAVRMAGPNEIWIAGVQHPGGPGMGFMRHSVDGGVTWQSVLDGQIQNVTRIALTPVDQPGGHPWGHVWVVPGYQPVAFHSPDAGRTWKLIDFQTRVPFLAQDICFVGDIPFQRDYIGYAVGSTQGAPTPTVLKTSDVGRSWKPLELPEGTPPLSRIYFATSEEGWVGGNGGVILYTTDGGRTWERRDLPGSTANQVVQALWFFRNGKGWAAFQQSFAGGRIQYEHTLFTTSDGGRNWIPVLSGRKDVHALWSNGPGTCWAVGNTPGYIASDFVGIYLNAR